MPHSGHRRVFTWFDCCTIVDSLSTVRSKLMKRCHAWKIVTAREVIVWLNAIETILPVKFNVMWIKSIVLNFAHVASYAQMAVMNVTSVHVWSPRTTMTGNFARNIMKLRFNKVFPHERKSNSLYLGKVFYLQCIERCEHVEPCLTTCNQNYYQSLKTCPCDDYCPHGCPCEGILNFL